MAAIKHTLQREVFFPNDESLFSVVHVTKEGKRKKACFLCAAVTTEKPVQVTLYQVKKSDKNDKSDSYKKKLSWLLRQVRLLDAKYSDKTGDSSEFDIHADKLYKWVASSVSEKNAFIHGLWRLSQMYLVQKPDFINVQPGLLDESLIVHDHEGAAMRLAAQAEQGGPGGADSDWRALSEKEQSDLETLMSQCDFAISNAEAFAEQLSKDLSVLDGANIHSIMGSEEQVLQLMSLLDEGTKEADLIEAKLNEYERVLECVKELMDTMKDKEALISIKNKNHKRLIEELESLVNKLSFDNNHIKCLLDADLMTSKGIHDCTLAARAILKCHSAEIKPVIYRERTVSTALMKMVAVQEQKRRLTSYKNSFAKRLSHHLNNLFIHQGNELGGGIALPSMNLQNELKLPPQKSCHKELAPYSDLMCWLKVVDPESFLKLKQVYTNSLGKLFDQQVKDFINSAKQNLSYHLGSKLDVNSASKRSSVITTPGSSTLPRKVARNNSSSSLNKSGDVGGGVDSSRLLLTPSLRHSKSNSQNVATAIREGGEYFDLVYEQVMSELEVWCVAEQDFCVRFFNLLDTDSHGNPTVATEAAASDGPWLQSNKVTDGRHKINESVRKMMSELFVSLETELSSLQSYGVALNSYNTMHMLVRMGEHVLQAEDTGSFLSQTFGNCLVQIKRDFDRFVDSLIHSMKDYKTNKKAKVGVIQFVYSFEEFARHSERIFKDSSRRRDLDKSYAKLMETLFIEIARVAGESQKTPQEVVQFENYHRIFALLSELKISSLDVSKKEAKKRYQEWLQTYMIAYLGQPLEKVNVFLNGIQAKIASGMRLEDVGFQVQFNRQELKRIIKEYSGKEVKKGLEQLYKKVDKHLCEEENLLQVVWHSMQDEFIKQYKYFEEMIAKCYPDAGISFEFTIQDLLSFFSDIAQSH